MLGKIIEWSVRNVFLVLLATFFVVAAGVYAVFNTPLDAIPDLSDVQVIIYTEYPGQALAPDPCRGTFHLRRAAARPHFAWPACPLKALAA